MSRSSTAARAGLALMILAALAGCGSASRGGTTVSASADVDPPAARPASGVAAAEPAAPADAKCAAKAMQVLQDIAVHVYHEGVLSERTATAKHFITTSIPLREAVEHADPATAQAVARALVAAGRMTDLRVVRDSTGPSAGGGEVLAEVGSPALAPISGTLRSAAGAPIATYQTSVWSDSGFIAETQGIIQGVASLRSQGHSIAGTLLPGELANAGTVRLNGADYRYSSFAATAYPSGSLRVYLLRATSSLTPLCGSSEQQTLVNTLRRVATLIYLSERGNHAIEQVRRVQRDPALLRAVARRDPIATRAAVESLLHEHVVRLRVSAGGRLLADVGGPDVLAPVSAPLSMGARRIGSFVLSVQDDEGYKRLAGRLAGLRVLMYMGEKLVKNSLGPAPASPPSSGPYRYGGQAFRVFTLHAQAFPSGPLRIVVLIPIPYS